MLHKTVTGRGLDIRLRAGYRGGVMNPAAQTSDVPAMGRLTATDAIAAVQGLGYAYACFFFGYAYFYFYAFDMAGGF